MSVINQSLRSTIQALAIVALHAGLNATTIGYWQFEGTPGAVVSSASSEVNSLDYTSSIGGTTGHAPKHSTNTPGKYIHDGASGTVVNDNNATSIQIAGTNGSGQFLMIHDGNSGKLAPTGSFTLEAFVKAVSGGTFGNIVTKEEFATTGSIGVTTDFKTDRVRIWTGGKRSDPIDTNQPMGSGLNNEQWHHIALVFDGVNTTTLFYDYKVLSTFNGTPSNSWQQNGPLSIGGVRGSTAADSIFSGYIDEVRLSETALNPHQFLVASDSPEARKIPTPPPTAAVTTRTPIIADFAADFNTSTPAPGWNYLWNPTGRGLTIQRSYALTSQIAGEHMQNAVDLNINRSMITSGAPTTKSTDGIDHYAIAAYTVQPGEAGQASIQNSKITTTDIKGSGKISIFVNKTLLGSDAISPNSSSSFDIQLGELQVGDTVYLALGPSDQDACSASIQFQIITQ